MTRLPRIKSAMVISGFDVNFEFTDGTSKVVNLLKYLRGPIFEAIQSDPQEFRKFCVDDRAGTIVWPNGADIDPDVLRTDREVATSTLVEKAS